MYISLFGKKEPKTKIYFTKGDKVVLGSNTTLEYAFQVGNFYNILQDSTTENSIKAYKHNLLVALNRLQFVEQAHPYYFTELLECIYIKDYKYTSREFCDLLVKLYPKYYTK
jgi:hypothetical protein